MIEERSPLETEKLISSLETAYGIDIHSIEFLPLGYDLNAAVYRVSTRDGLSYFLKVKYDAVSELAVQLPHFLKTQGIEQVVAPLQTQTGTFWFKLEDANLILYPFIEGQSGMRIGLTENQWRELGRTLKRIHTIELNPELSAYLDKENFLPHPRSYPLAREIHATILEKNFDRDSARELAAVWRKNYDEINLIFERTESLSQQLQSCKAEFSLCHSDIHTANLLITADGSLFIVDWDQPILAPKERDLMFIMGDKVGGFVIDPQQEKLFFEGYGKAEVNWQILSYYRYERILQELGEFGRQVLMSDAFSEEDNQQSVYWFSRMFQSGDLLEMTHEGYKKL